MANKWNKYKLDFFVEINPAERLPCGIKAKKISMDKISTASKSISGFEFSEVVGGARFRNGDTLLPKITPCLENGKIGFVDNLEEGEIAFGSTEFTVLRSNKNSDPHFVYYFAKSPLFHNTAICLMEGTSGRKRVNERALASCKFVIPNLPTQCSIARLLSQLDEKIELNRKINSELENLARTIFIYNFVQNANPKWKQGKLSDIAVITMGQSPDGVSYNETGDGIVFFQGCTDFGTRYPNVRLYTTSATRYAKKDDILLSVRAPVGTINIANMDCCIGRGLAALRGKTENNCFLYFTLKQFEPYFKMINGTGTTFGAITKDQLYDLPVRIPPQNTVSDFENIVNPIFLKQFNLDIENRELAALRDFLLPLLMNGQVTVEGIA